MSHEELATTRENLNMWTMDQVTEESLSQSVSTCTYLSCIIWQCEKTKL